MLAVFNGDGDSVSAVDATTPTVIVLDQTAFYAESGGQAGDWACYAAMLRVFRSDTQISGDQFLHIGQLLSGTISPGDTA